MSRPTLAISLLVLLTLTHAAGVLVFLEDPERLRVWHDAAGWIASVAGVVGTAYAVGAFAPGDHLRKVWGLLLASSVLLLVGTGLRSHWTHFAPGRDFLESPLLIPRFFVVAAANVCATWALVLAVTTYKKAGLAAERSPRANGLWALVSLAAVALAARQFAIDLGRFGTLEGSFSALTSMFSTVGDAVTIILIVPLLRIAYLLRGGRLSWGWWALGLSGAVWLLYDAREWLAALGTTDVANLELLRALRTPGLALVGLAGFLQREALREAEPHSSSGNRVAISPRM